MVTSQQLRSRAAEFGELIKVAPRPDAIHELRRQERMLIDLADNQDWLANNRNKIVRPARKEDADDLMPRPTAKSRGDGAPLEEDEERILRCLGAAVIMQWNSLPTKLQKELFGNASRVRGLSPAGMMKEQIARFLHSHKDDVAPNS